MKALSQITITAISEITLSPEGLKIGVIQNTVRVTPNSILSIDAVGEVNEAEAKLIHHLLAEAVMKTAMEYNPSAEQTTVHNDNSGTVPPKSAN